MDINLIFNSVITISGMGLLFGAGLGYAAKKFHVEEDITVVLVREALPGANCGGCGFVGCDDLAKAIVSGEAKPNSCPVGGNECTQKVSDILGIEAILQEKQVSFIKCKGGSSKSTFLYDYYGINDCSAIMQLAGGGSKSCTYGCLGGGSCVAACMFDAIKIVDGIAVVDKEKCTACGMCVSPCPKKLIEIVPYANDVFVSCNSKDNGKTVRSHCTVGCISCKMCEKACEFDAIHVDNFLATVDYSKCTMCNACALKCPTKAITFKTAFINQII